LPYQIYGLRPFYNDLTKKIDIKHKRFKVKAKSVESLFDNLENILSDIPEKEHYNLYWTAANCKDGSRSMANQEIIPFDIDDIHISEQEEYVDPVCSALGVNPEECIIIYTGNGLQVIVKIAEPFDNNKYFHEYKASYIEFCHKIDASLDASGLPGKADPTVFSPARLLRLPLTRNIKPIKYTDAKLLKTHNIAIEEAVKSKHALICNREIKTSTFNLTKMDVVPVKEKDKSFVRPDHDTIVTECQFLQWCLSYQEELSEPEWYAALSITAHFEDDQAASHQLSRATTTREEADAKIDQALEASGPRSCENIKSLSGKCSGCIHWGKIKSPISIKAKDFYITELIEGEGGKSPSEMQIVYKLLEMYGISFDIRSLKADPLASKIIKQECDLFHYDGRKWNLISEKELAEMCVSISHLYKHKASNQKVESTFKFFKKYLPHVPKNVDLFLPKTDMVNFLNGTLHMDQKSNGQYELNFREHFQGNFLINLINLNYDPKLRETNISLKDSLNKYFGEDDDKEEKIQSVKEMFGAAIMPSFPRLFFLYGIPGSGKSTICILLSHLLEQTNMCMVQPKDFHGFQMESMAGKLVNMVTDIKSNSVIDDDVVKQIEDRRPVRIQRKGRKDIYSPLPAVHIFGANNLPQTFEGSTRAHDRRWTFLEFQKSLIKTDDKGDFIYTRNYANLIFDSNPQGVLNFAIEGLNLLIEKKGNFTMPESGKKKLREWQKENDPIALFLDDIREDGKEYNIVLHEEKNIYRKELWDIFQQWKKDVGREKSKITRNKFYECIRKAGIKERILDGYTCYVGIGIEEGMAPRGCGADY